MKQKKKIIWAAAALLIALLTIRAVFSGSGMTLQQLREGIASADWRWMIPAVLWMLGIICFEGEALRIILRSVGYRRNRCRGFLYSAADAYFSAITPSATGGQPASAFFMIRDGIAGPVAAAVLLMNLMLYTVSLWVLGLVCMILRPGVFAWLSLGSRILIGAGMAVITGQAVLFWLALKKPVLLQRISDALIRLLSRIHLVRHPEKQRAKMEHMLQEYGSCVELLSGHSGTLAAAFALNLLQRASQFTVVVFVYRALCGSFSHALDLWVMQCLIYIGVYCVPIPGSMGVTDALMLDGYRNLMPKTRAFQVQMLARGLSFYCCVLISAVTVLAGYLASRHRNSSQGNDRSEKKS